MRIAVVGTSGAGKTTLAHRIASRLGLPHIELDAINWQSGWRDLTRHDPPEFVRRVSEAVRAEAWVVDGNYRLVREKVSQRATHLVWLDYERPVVMARVISRTFLRGVLRTELWAGNRERWRHMLLAQSSDQVGLEHQGAAALGDRRTAVAAAMRSSRGRPAPHPREARQAVELLAKATGVENCVGAARGSG